MFGVVRITSRRLRKIRLLIMFQQQQVEFTPSLLLMSMVARQRPRQVLQLILYRFRQQVAILRNVLAIH